MFIFRCDPAAMTPQLNARYLLSHSFCIFTKDGGCSRGGETGWVEAAAELSGAAAEAEAVVV